MEAMGYKVGNKMDDYPDILFLIDSRRSDIVKVKVKVKYFVLLWEIERCINLWLFEAAECEGD